MIKVFLVEDEAIVRRGIKSMIDWEGNGFAFVGEAGDGELAFPMIQEQKPDILITDIKMPFMDGLELSRLVREELPETKIIILSGYDEFAYAKQAISIGINEYLLKPIAGSKLLEAVKKIGRVIEEEREQKVYLQRFEKEQQENSRLDRKDFFDRLVTGQMSFSEILEEGRGCGIDLVASGYRIVLFQIFASEQPDEYSESYNHLTDEIVRITEQTKNVIMIERGLEGWAFIMKEAADGPNLETLTNSFLESICAQVKQYPGLEYFAGVGMEIQRASEFGKSFESANRAFAYRYIRQRNQVICAGREEQSEEDSLSLISFSTKHVDRAVVERFLVGGLKSDAEEFVESCFRNIGEKNSRSLIFRQYLVMDMYMAALGVVERLDYSSEALVERCGEYTQMTDVFSSLEKAKSYIINVFETAMELRDEAAQKKYSVLIHDSVDYIREHYAEEEISLNTVAASVNISPSHFSTVFKSETGQTFIECLTAIRMEKAKELLRSTSMKTAEIGNAVGYKDSHYFSYLFKKTQDITPREFRGRV